MLAIFLFNRADRIVFQTEQQQNFFGRKAFDKSVIIGNFAKDYLFSIKATEDKKNIIGVGRLHRQKNWSLAIKAFSQISDRIADDLIIYGEGEERQRLEELIDQLGMANRIVLAGQTDNIPQKIANSKCLLLTSDYEGTPNVIIEAQIVGTPCVSTRFSGGGAEALINDGVTGVLVEPGNTKELATHILETVKDDLYSAALARNALENSAAFRASTVLKQWNSLFCTLTVGENL
jgi:glycosyltransferase involved in cell wall biosynthesis